MPPARVSFLFRRSQAAGHCAGVNALALSTDDSQLWTGSRDSVISCWDATHKPKPELLHKHVGHTDWVNDLVLAGDVLVSCSSDKTLRVWQRSSPDAALGCLQGHSDYVTCLAASASGTLLASGGLKGEVRLWDLAALKAVISGGVRGQAYGASPAMVPHDSVYAVDMNSVGSLLVAGSTQGVASVVDVRSGQGVMTLSGHTDNIRALQLDGEGRMLLSGSADHSVRLWDLGQQRCVQTLVMHTDSVWALAPCSNFAVVYSGGRDGCIYRTRLVTRVSELIACEEEPVMRLAAGSCERHLWAATTSPSVHLWEYEAAELGLVGGGGWGEGTVPLSFQAPQRATVALQQQPRPSCLVASPTAAARARLVFDGNGSCPAPLQQQPAAATPSIPPIQHATVLTDRRYVVTRDAAGDVACWDLTTGSIMRNFGQADVKEVEASLFQPSHSVSAWCAVDVKLGSLGGSMEPPHCFGAEIYAQDLGDEEAPGELKVNFGEQMLVALFAGWAGRQHCTAQAGTRQRQEEQMHQGADADGEAQCGSSTVPFSRFSFQTSVPPVVMVNGDGNCDGDGLMPWRCPIDSFTGQEELPQWVSDCVLHGQYPVCRELKMAFQLMPLPGSQLPSLLQSKLNAPRVLRVNKVADYVRRKMDEHGIALEEEPLFWNPVNEERWQAEQADVDSCAGAAVSVQQLQPIQAAKGGARTIGAGAVGSGATLITCKGQIVPWDFSLAAVRQFIWRRSDDLVLHYSVRDPSCPLRLPSIHPPS